MTPGAAVPARELSPRFTAWLPEERELLTRCASEQGTSENYIVRIALRLLFGLPVPRQYLELAGRPLLEQDRELVLGGERAATE